MVKDNQNQLLNKAIALAVISYENKYDHNGPSILYPLSVMFALPQTACIDTKIVTVLHGLDPADVCGHGFSVAVSHALALLRPKDNVSYAHNIVALSGSNIASTVKLAYLKYDNDLSNKEYISKEDIDNMALYHASYKYLTDEITYNQFLKLVA